MILVPILILFFLLELEIPFEWEKSSKIIQCNYSGYLFQEKEGEDPYDPYEYGLPNEMITCCYFDFDFDFDGMLVDMVYGCVSWK